MSKKKAHKAIAEMRRQYDAELKAQQEKQAKKEPPLEIKDNKVVIPEPKGNTEKYDPVKHKGYVLLYKKNRPEPMWLPPAQVKAMRSNGWKTEAEVKKRYALWFKKHPEANVIPAGMCPLCGGGKRMWVQCHLIQDSGCGCEALPVLNDCRLCSGTGELPAAVVLTDDLTHEINDQKEITDWMKREHPGRI